MHGTLQERAAKLLQDLARNAAENEGEVTSIVLNSRDDQHGFYLLTQAEDAIYDAEQRRLNEAMESVANETLIDHRYWFGYNSVVSEGLLADDYLSDTIQGIADFIESLIDSEANKSAQSLAMLEYSRRAGHATHPDTDTQALPHLPGMTEHLQKVFDASYRPPEQA